MNLLERSYSGKIFRPRPEIHCEPSGNLCLVATPWGPRLAAKKVIQSIQDFFLSAKSDDEVTSPFQTITCLSPMANNLRVAVMLANDTVYREENRSEYRAGVELFVAARNEQECVWVQIGQPHVLLDRGHLDLIQLGAAADLSLQYSNDQQMLSPLPQNLLGTSSTSNFSVNSFSLQSNDRFILLGRTVLPPRLLVSEPQERELNAISKLLSQHSAEMPFWVGILDF